MKSLRSPVVYRRVGALALPFALLAGGLTLTSATDVVIFAIACMALNMLVGHTGLVSFGHGAWFGLGAYAAALAQRHWFPGSMLWPALFALAFLSWSPVSDRLPRAAPARRLFFAADARVLRADATRSRFAGRAFTGGENGLGGVTRANWFGVDLDNAWVYYALVASIGVGVVVRAAALPSLADRHRCWSRSARTSSARSSSAMPTQRYKQIAFVLSATLTRLRRRAVRVSSSLRVGRSDRRSRSPANCSRW